MSLAEPSYLDLQPDPVDNQASPPIGAPEGQYAGKHVNDTFRWLMACIRRLGDASLLFTSATEADASSRKIINMAFGTARGHAATVGQLHDGRFWWGGVSTGSANAQVISVFPSFANGSYQAGNIFRFIAGFTNTSTFTLNAGPGAVLVRDVYGNNPGAGVVQAGRRHTVEHDGANFRLLDPVGWMDQALYDMLFPVNGPIQVRFDTVNPNTLIPRGVTASWSQIADTDRFIRISTSSTPGSTGGSDVDPLPNHTHPDGSLQVAIPQATPDHASGGNAGGASGTFNIQGDTGNPNSNPNIVIIPKHRNFRAWYRNA